MKESSHTKNKNHKRNKRMWIYLIILILTVLFCYWQNNDLVTTKIEAQNAKIPKEFNDYKIVQISDLHNNLFGKNQKRLIRLVEKQNPDIIVITGDLFGDEQMEKSSKNSMDFVRGAVKICPVYYVPGNHEAWSKNYAEQEKLLKDEGVTLLNNEKTQLKKGNALVELLGIKDPDFSFDDDTIFEDVLKEISNGESDRYKILLSHRPEKIDEYAKNKIDLVFCGHAHGGQVRLPFIGGLYAPNQGILPKYTAGRYTQGDTTEIVSRGLGVNGRLVRVFNRPDVVVVTLISE